MFVIPGAILKDADTPKDKFQRKYSNNPRGGRREETQKPDEEKTRQRPNPNRSIVQRRGLPWLSRGQDSQLPLGLGSIPPWSGN